jgi:PAS domain S-box-containing protein
MKRKFPAGDGEMRERVRAFDWSATDLGPIDGWPQSLKTAVELMMATPLPIVMVWGEKRLMLYNDLYAVFAGKRHPQALGAAVRDIWPEITDINAGIIDRVMAGESITLEGERRILYRKDVAEEVWMNLHYATVRDEGGTGIAAMITVIETTEKRAMEGRLKAREALFRTMAESIPNHAWTGGPDGMLDWFNRRVYEYTGAEAPELDGDRWGAVVHPDDLPRASERWAKSLSDGSPYEVEFRLRRHDGAYSWFLGRALPVRDETGRIIRWIGTNTDISRQREVEEAQRALNLTLEMRLAERTADRDRMWQLSQDLMVVVNDTPEVPIMAVNPAWQRMLGWSPAEMLGRSAVDFIHPDDMLPLQQGLQPYKETLTVDGRLVRTYDNRYRHKDGTWRWISWTVVADDGVLQGVGRDVTADKARAEALALTEAQLRQAQKMEAVGQLTGGIAHDFNNMLAVVIGSLGLVTRRLAKGDTDVSRLAESALESATRAASLTHRLLAFSRQQPLNPEAIAANRLVSGMSELLARTLGETIRVETALDPALWPAQADPHQLESAVLNLAVNARDAMPEGGVLTIRTANVEIGERDARLHPGVAPGRYVTIAVADTGIGMKPEIAARAFEPFFTTKEVGKGTGLGLSQVYGFVQQSGGHVLIDSTLGHGTAVRLYLPRSHPDAEAKAPRRSLEPNMSDEAATILIVEDEPAMRQLAIEALGELGYRVLEADSAATALKTLQAHPEIDLMFTDFVMPAMNGAKLVEMARLQRPDLRVLFTTGYTRDAAVQNGMLEAGVELLGKPYTIDQLSTKILEVLRP